jgi:hypothetical protein
LVEGHRSRVSCLLVHDEVDVDDDGAVNDATLSAKAVIIELDLLDTLDEEGWWARHRMHLNQRRTRPNDQRRDPAPTRLGASPVRTKQ